MLAVEMIVKGTENLVDSEIGTYFDARIIAEIVERRHGEARLVVLHGRFTYEEITVAD